MSISKQQVIDAEIGLLDSMKNADLNSLEVLLHDDLLFVIPSGETITKSMDLESWKRGHLKLESIEIDDQQISVIDEVAIVSTLIEMKGTYQGDPIDGKFKYIRTWKSVHDQLKVVGGAGMVI